MKDRAMAEIELLGAWKGKTKKKIAIGVVSHRTLNAETPAEVADEVRKALKYIDIENLLLTSDCGFGRQGANIVRREYGLAESYVPCADPRLSQDVVPTTFEDIGGESAAARRAFEPPAPAPGFARPAGDGASRGPPPTQRFSELRRERR